MEIQKLAYLLQAAGEPLRLQFIQGDQEPYAANLHPVLCQLEGHTIEGYRPDDDAAELETLLLYLAFSTANKSALPLTG
ncbi:MAG TPA: hypothetical protein V6C78_19365 [Crinalium sp.]